jgi:hypothetical protein
MYDICYICHQEDHFSSNCKLKHKNNPININNIIEPNIETNIEPNIEPISKRRYQQLEFKKEPTIKLMTFEEQIYANLIKELDKNK